MLRHSVVDKSRTKPDHAEHTRRRRAFENLLKQPKGRATERDWLDESEAVWRLRRKEVSQQDLKASSLSGSSRRTDFEIKWHSFVNLSVSDWKIFKCHKMPLRRYLVGKVLDLCSLKLSKGICFFYCHLLFIKIRLEETQVSGRL